MTDTGLTEREEQVLHLLAQGLNNVQIADELNLGKQTIRNYVSRIYSKLEVSSRVEAAFCAKSHGVE